MELHPLNERPQLTVASKGLANMGVKGMEQYVAVIGITVDYTPAEINFMQKARHGWVWCYAGGDSVTIPEPEAKFIGWCTKEELQEALGRGFSPPGVAY